MNIFLHLFVTFFKIGLFTIGGGYAMIPMIQNEVVSNGWLTVNELVDFIAVSESTPGPFAVNIATYIGIETGGFLGAACATLGVVLPSFLIILIIARSFMNFKDNKYVVGALSGLRPAVVGLIASAIFSIGIINILPGVDSLFNIGKLTGTINYKTILIIGIVLLISKFKEMHPILLIGLSAGLGIVFFGFCQII